ncbi:MAG: 3'(2'),5'-bisphosphate nucleotidase CysQ [Streptosporangiales bacterium]|nr:3'(2'),5'-bisphosphate nucleotidase CysQ [Streptosporangiales bacterium]
MTSQELDDHAVARTAARRTGEALLRLRAERGDGDPGALRDEGDRVAQGVLADFLGQARPADIVFSEEAPDDERRLGADRVWIIDPLDGTREYGELDRSDWAVHVALWETGRLVAGAVALPALGMVLTADNPPALSHLRTPSRILVSRTRPPAEAVRLAEVLPGELVPMGSAGAKVAAVVRGEAEAYVHAGGQYQWDSAAPIAVARAAGLHTSRLDGSPLTYDTAERSLPDLVVCRQEIAGRVMNALNAAHAV